VWDVGGQKTLRPYWRNYFEQTEGLVWVVDSTDRRRLADCAEELGRLLLEERLAGATLLIMANKQDVPGALGADDIKAVSRMKGRGCSLASGWCAVEPQEGWLELSSWAVGSWYSSLL
jgi:ADP-ribosylation factor-like protein 2